jgi:hypothetical protein
MRQQCGDCVAWWSAHGGWREHRKDAHPALRLIFGCPPARLGCSRPSLFVFLAVEARVGFTPDHTDIEKADGKTLAAMTATYGIAKNKEISQIFELQARGT